MKLQLHKSLLSMVAAALLLSSAPVHGYSYAEAEDEMALLFQSAVVAAKDGKWGEVSGLAKKGIGMQKGHLFSADYLAPRFNKAVAEQNVSAAAETFANLVYISIREKLHRNSKDSFKDHKGAKARLNLARKSYLDVLDGNVKKQDPKRSSDILGQFDATLQSIGNPGLFGIGKREPDPAAYGRAVETIESLVMQSFPVFAK